MNHEKQRLADIRRRLELIKLERERQNREFEELERAMGGDEAEMRRLAVEIDRCVEQAKRNQSGAPAGAIIGVMFV
jgi:predicted  nucleic acid-binding Zn-ribbon protein